MQKRRDIFDPDIKQISGPINVARLEGMVNGIKKVIYLFMDWHEDLPKQTECPSVFSRDLNKYLAESFYQLNSEDRTYDFFMEIRPTDILGSSEVNLQTSTFKEIYIWQVIKLFSLIFKYDQSNDAVQTSDIFKNVRLHYLDIRDYLKYHIHGLIANAYESSMQFMHYGYINLSHLYYIMNLLREAKQDLDKTIEIFASRDKPKVNLDKSETAPEKLPVIKPYSGFQKETIERLILKIRQSYKHPNIQNELVSIFDDCVKQLENLSNDIDKTIQMLDSIGNVVYENENRLYYDPDTKYYFYGVSPAAIRQMIMQIITACEKNNRDCITIFARITDVYFLRRFLDKDYITNAIVYSGISHSRTYMKVLIENFNFRITHAAYAPGGDIGKLNSKIKESKDANIDELVYPPVLFQCSDITSFPEKFL